MIDTRIAICAGASLVLHAALGRGLEALPPREAFQPPARVEVRIVEPAKPLPPPEPPKAPEPPKPEPPKVVHEKPRVQQPAIQAEAPKEAPPPDRPAPTATTDQPVFGVSIESTSQAGTGPAVPVGNTTQPAPTSDAPAAREKLAQPAAAADVTKMPMPQGRCSGKYTDAARAAALEGVVVLDLIVDEHGRARDITVVSGLGEGLTEAAITALRECRFTPGEKAGAAVPVRVRGFKIRFLLQDGGE